LNQRGHARAQGKRNLSNDDDRRDSLAPLQHPNVVPAEASGVPQRFLGQTGCLAPAAAAVHVPKLLCEWFHATSKRGTALHGPSIIV
jgi:hypothetical protein